MEELLLRLLASLLLCWASEIHKKLRNLPKLMEIKFRLNLTKIEFFFFKTKWEIFYDISSRQISTKI